MKIIESTPENLERAGEVIRNGGLVVMPTETVYGLAADALDAKAVEKIYAAKGRPASNPLIVHVADWGTVEEIAYPTDLAKRLADKFWPGPLTLVLAKKPVVPKETTAGLDSVAVRMPAHPVAQGLIKAAGRPLAAPSANAFTRLSPTRAEDVGDLLGVELILQGGPCEVGIESTVVDCRREEPIVLRPGQISLEQLQAVVPTTRSGAASEKVRAPGHHSRHYAPRTTIRMALRIGSEETGLTFQSPQNSRQIQMPVDPAGYAAELYHALHALDEVGAEYLVVEEPPREPGWDAIWDRLTRATS